MIGSQWQISSLVMSKQLLGEVRLIYDRLRVRSWVISNYHLAAVLHTPHMCHHTVFPRHRLSFKHAIRLLAGIFGVDNVISGS